MMTQTPFPEQTLIDIGVQAARLAYENLTGTEPGKESFDSYVHALAAYVADAIRPYGITSQAAVWSCQSTAITAFGAELRALGYFPDPADIEWTAEARETRAAIRVRALSVAHVAFCAVSALPADATEQEMVEPIGTGIAAMLGAVRDLISDHHTDAGIVAAWESMAVSAFMAEYDRLREAWNSDERGHA